MINGFHAIIYTNDAEADRAFFRDVLRFPYADAGQGWLIFAVPPAEVGFHPTEPEGSAPSGHHSIYLMCDDINKTVTDLQSRGVRFNGNPSDQGWGIVATMRLPGGSDLSIYQPRHPRPKHAH